MLDIIVKQVNRLTQLAIDKAKGIIAKPMPREWYDRHSVNQIDDPERRRFYHEIVADKKPYFMRIIYPTLMKQYNTYITNTNKKALREFRIPMEELLAKPESERSNEEREFVRYYLAKMPVGNNDCVMNRICRRFEQEFDGYITRHSSDTVFDYEIMKSGQEYTASQYNEIMRLYIAYNRRVQDYMQYSKKERLDDDERANQRAVMIQEFKRACQEVCSGRQQLCDILLDICYQKEGSKQFVWDLAGEEIIENLLRNNGFRIAYPVVDENGDLVFGGERFSFSIKQIGGAEDERSFE